MGPSKRKSSHSTGDNSMASDPDSENHTAAASSSRPAKKAKTTSTSASKDTTSSHFSNGHTSTSSPFPNPELDAEGNTFFPLSKTRRLTISSFKGKTMVSVREYYESGGKMLPGKKGISLTMEQYNTLVECLPAVELVLKGKMDEKTVGRPNYRERERGPRGGDRVDEEEDDDDDDRSMDGGQIMEELEEGWHKQMDATERRWERRRNIEVTSDEDDG